MITSLQYLAKSKDVQIRQQNLGINLTKINCTSIYASRICQLGLTVQK